MSQAPAWVIALRKSNRVLRDNDHVYATLEVIKAQYNRYDQDGKIRLPHYRDFNDEQTNTYWADIFSSDEDTDMFISEVKRQFQPRGLDATIDRLQYYKANGGFKINEIADLQFTKKQSKKKIDARIDKVVNEVLPFLEDKKRTGKQTAGTKGGTASGLTRINVEMQDVTKDKISDVLENNFDTWDEDQQMRYLDNLNKLLNKDRRKIKELRPFLTQRYGKKMLPLMRKWKWDRENRVTVSTDKDLSSLGFKSETIRGKPFQVISSFTGDKKKLRADIKNITGSGRGIEIKNKPVYDVFGAIDSFQEYGKESPQGMIFDKYELVEPFTSENAAYYLEKIMRSKQFGDKMSPRRLLTIKQRSDFLHRSLLKLLDGKYESSLADGTMADTFIASMDNMKFANEKYRLTHYAQKVFDTSNPFNPISNPKMGTIYDPTSDYYLDIGERDDFESPPKFREYKDRIIDELKGTGSISDAYKEEKKTLERNLRYLQYSISVPQKEFLETILDPEFRDEILQDIPSDESEQTDNQKEILELVQQLSAIDLDTRMTKKTVKYGDEEFDVFSMTESTYKLVDKLLMLSGLESEGTELRNELEDYEEQIVEFDTKLAEKGKVFDVNFDETQFSEGHEQDIAEIAYRGLAAGHTLNKVLGGNVIKDSIDNLDNLYNVIIGAGRIYFPSDRDRLNSLADNVQPREDLDLSTSPYASEIKEVAKIIKEMIPKLRTIIVKDIANKIKQILSESIYYQQTTRGKAPKKKKGKMVVSQNFLQILENKGIIKAVEQ